MRAGLFRGETDGGWIGGGLLGRLRLLHGSGALEGVGLARAWRRGEFSFWLDGSSGPWASAWSGAAGLRSGFGGRCRGVERGRRRRWIGGQRHVWNRGHRVFVRRLGAHLAIADPHQDQEGERSETPKHRPVSFAWLARARQHIEMLVLCVLLTIHKRRVELRPHGIGAAVVAAVFSLLEEIARIVADMGRRGVMDLGGFLGARGLHGSFRLSRPGSWGSFASHMARNAERDSVRRLVALSAGGALGARVFTSQLAPMVFQAHRARGEHRGNPILLRLASGRRRGISIIKSHRRWRRGFAERGCARTRDFIEPHPKKRARSHALARLGFPSSGRRSRGARNGRCEPLMTTL
jgi:hypothetical protein